MKRDSIFFFNNSLVIDESLQCSTRFMVSEGEGLTPGKKTVSVTQNFCSRNFIKAIVIEKASDIDIKKKIERLPALLVFSRALYISLLAVENRKIPQGCKNFSQTFTHNIHSEMTWAWEISQKERVNQEFKVVEVLPRPTSISYILSFKKACSWTRNIATYETYVSKAKEREKERMFTYSLMGP